MGLEKIQSRAQFESILKENSRVLLLKNSITCPISRQAFNEYQQFSQALEDQVYYLNVQESRDLSHWIADEFLTKHESPQVLLFDNNQVIWNASHFNITTDALKKHWL